MAHLKIHFGNHFFRDLIKSNIFQLAIYPDHEGMNCYCNFSYNTPNKLAEFLNIESGKNNNFHLIKVASYHPNHDIELVMDGYNGQSFAYLERD